MESKFMKQLRKIEVVLTLVYKRRIVKGKKK